VTIKQDKLEGRQTNCWRVVMVNSALHPSGVAKSSTSFSWGKGGKVSHLCRVAGNSVWSHMACDFP